MVNINDQEYTGMTTYMEELNKQVYQLIDYMDGRTYENDTYEVVVPVADDTYLQLSGSNQNEVQGNNAQLSLSAPPSASGMREILLKFNLGNYSDSLHRVVDANIRLYYLSGDGNQKLSICGIKENNWDEETLTGTLALSTSGLRDNYGKGRIKNYVLPSADTSVNLNVRNWLLGEVSTADACFRIASENSSLFASYWASKEHENTLMHPMLILTFSKDGLNAVDENSQSEKINIYVKNDYLHVTGLTEPAICEVFSVSGQKIKSVNIDSDLSIPLDRLNGTYIVRLKSNMMLITRKIQIS